MGLHARHAGLIVQEAKRYQSAITVELGEKSAEYHKKVGKYVAGSGADRLYCYGDLARNYIIGAVENGFDKRHCMHFSDRDELADYLKKKLVNGDSVLLKGSRGMALEEVFKAL